MAISIITSPNDWQNVFNEIAFNVSSNNSTRDNFNFLVDVNVSGQTNPVSRLIYPKQPNSGSLDLDISNVLRDYVSYDIRSFNVSGLIESTDSYCKYWIEFGEIYDVSGVPTIYANQTQFGASGSPKQATNAAFDFLEWSKTAYSTGLLLSETNNVALNQSTFRDKLRPNNQRWLSFFDKNQEIVVTDFFIYDSLGNQLFSNSYSSYTNTGKIQSINVGWDMFDFFGASGFLENEAATSYEVRFANGGDSTLYSYVADIDHTCSKFGSIRLHWFNKFGGFDSFNFNRVNKPLTEIIRKQFKQFQPLNYSKQIRLRTNYFNESIDSIEINSDLLTNEEWEGLKELLLSPCVLYEYDKDNYYPVNITESNYEIKKVVNEQRPTSLVLNIEYTFNNVRQQL
jgi:hypothetical protein